MLHPRNRPTYARARTDDEPILEPDIIELSQLDSPGGYDDWERRSSQPASIYSGTASYQDRSQTKRYEPVNLDDTYERDCDDQHLLASKSQSSTQIAAKWRRFELARLPGWRRTTLVASCIATFSLTINFITMIWLSRRPSEMSLVELSQGDCTNIQKADTLMHLAINILSTLLLSGSNYCMQCLSAPTRKEVDAAHQRGKYLDIGVPGLRNLGSIARYKVALWFALAISSVPLHLLYNSAIYSSLATYDYKIVVVTNHFLNNISNQTMYLGSNSDLSKYQRLNASDCITQYAQVFISDRADLVIVSSNASTHSVLTNSSWDLNDFGIMTGDDVSGNQSPFSWICSSDPEIQNKTELPKGYQSLPCSSYVGRIKNIANQWAPFGYPIDYCLSQPMEGKCSLNGNIPIIIIVVVSNAVKVAIMLFITFYLVEDPLLTAGDAIGSFLHEPDPTTRGLCLLSRPQVRSSVYNAFNENYKWPKKSDGPVSISMTASVPSYTYFRAANVIRWILTVILFILCYINVAALLGMGDSAISSGGLSIWKSGLGTPTPGAIISGWDIDQIKTPSKQILAAILIANTPQLVLSFLYFSLNGLLTATWLASEWSDFDKDRKALRVSNPRGQQRGTYFLQLPYKVAIPLLIMSALLHWLVSQSIFLAVISEWDSNDQLVNPVAIASCGFSPLAMLLVLIVATVIAVATLFMASRKVKTTMRLAGSCSAVISAACHPPPWDNGKLAAEKPVMWGVTHRVIGMDDVAHCSFSSEKVYPLIEGKQYL